MKFIWELCGGSHKEPKESKINNYLQVRSHVDQLGHCNKCIWQGHMTKLAKLIRVHIIQNKRGSQQEALCTSCIHMPHC